MEKVVIITGASSGIGKALAFEMYKKGYSLCLASRNIDELNKVYEELNKTSNQNKNKVILVKTDVSIEENCKNLINKCIEYFGKIDILINNAGISMRAIFEEVDLSVIKKLMDVNFWGAVYCSKYALPYILQEKGSIVGISSIAGNKGLPARTGYSASKFALEGFLETLRIENLKTGLHVLIACPGFTSSNIRKTALTKDGTIQAETPRNEDKMLSSEYVAKKIVRAIEKRKRKIIIGFEGKALLLINKFLPSIADKLVFNEMIKEPNSPIKVI